MAAGMGQWAWCESCAGVPVGPVLARPPLGNLLLPFQLHHSPQLSGTFGGSHKSQSQGISLGQLSLSPPKQSWGPKSHPGLYPCLYML